ncbi:MAG: hypothetical protein CBB71_04720 [Rhodopirellula sp. TMED11]|nr:MAG: hypothetical protein CBB71_04720 [Rhodopirellula sp. TMED11]
MTQLMIDAILLAMATSLLLKEACCHHDPMSIFTPSYQELLIHESQGSSHPDQFGRCNLLCKRAHCIWMPAVQANKLPKVSVLPAAEGTCSRPVFTSTFVLQPLPIGSGCRSARRGRTSDASSAQSR